MLVSTKLKEGKALISDPKNWTTKCSARDALGNPVAAEDKSAVCYCTLGTVGKVAGDDYMDSRMCDYILKAVLQRTHGVEYRISKFNDVNTHDQVMMMWDLAIQMAEKEEQSWANLVYSSLALIVKAYMPARINFNRGDRIGDTRLTFLADKPNKGKRRQALFICDCGTKIETDLNWVRFNNITSCGCYKSELVAEKNFKHGHAVRGKESEAYKAWQAMHNRVSCDPYYTNITICDRWSGESGFNNFFMDMGDRPVGLTLDRINNNLGYEPSNCRWATWSEQNLNKGY